MSRPSSPEGAALPEFRGREARSALEQARAPEREPELMALLRVVRVDAELTKPAHPIHHGVAMDAETFGRLADAPAVEQRLERRHELEPPIGGTDGERTEHPVDERA